MSSPSQNSWTLQDLGFFLGAVLPSWLIASLLTSPFSTWTSNRSAASLLWQVLFEALLLGVLCALAHYRHHQPIAGALGWTLEFPGAWLCVFFAPLLALASNLLAALCHAPLIPSALDQLEAGSIPRPIVGLFAVVVGPLFEELAFRGFLQPLLQHRWGTFFGLIGAAAAFSLLHLPQSDWAWQYFTIYFLVGAAFGFARHYTGSTAASFLLHMGFNLTQFTASVLSRN